MDEIAGEEYGPQPTFAVSPKTIRRQQKEVKKWYALQCVLSGGQTAR